VRASNTQAVLVVRFEARTAARLEEIRRLFMEPLRRLGVGEATVGH
jgi:phosphomannomutase